MDERELKELGTTLGDIMAFLSSYIREKQEDDLREAYQLTNKLYSKYIKYDTKKD